MFQEILKQTFDEREKKVLSFWEKENIFLKSLENREGKPLYSFYDGPPFATGLPHYGHFLAGTIKDVIPRYKTMKGFYVSRRFGWDCHGLPVEHEIEKTHSLSGAKAIEEFGIKNFNEECRSIVLRYSKEWEQSVLRMGRWVDFSKTWKTMDLPFMESVWWVFSELHKKGLIYEGHKVMPFSAKLGTPLSNFEAGENYKDVDDPSLTIHFPLCDDPETVFLAWTTTPWTLISHLALMVGPEIEYVKIHDHHVGKNFILAKARLPVYYPDEGTYSILESLKGKDLEGMTYEPPFEYFSDQKSAGAFRVIIEKEVSLEEGTGIVHAAPAFGETDFYACQKVGIDLVCPVDNNGQFTSEIPEYSGLFVKDADKAIIKTLKEKGKVHTHQTIRHRYPFCWRSDTPLIYKAVRTWFVAVESIKEKLIAANEQINWMPSYLKKGRFGKWLEGARDWAISRNRYWGTPIPLWRAEDGSIHVVGSVKELEELTGEKISDLHRHNIDALTFEKDGKLFKRIPEVFDCWFESGSMPYGQHHYPFENSETFERAFPADFIAEGLDQTRGWFYTLTVLSAALFEKPAFKNVVVNGLILAENGAKMSKRLKNYPDPAEVIGANGADAVRLYMLDSPAAKADDLCFTKKGVELELRQVLIPLWNAYTFFITYARIYNWRPEGKLDKPKAEIDRWILTSVEGLVSQVEEGLDAYDLPRAVKPFVGFIDDLTNWYIRRSRRRFWAEEDTLDRREAFSTLYEVLLTLVKVAAPFIPFISETIYRNLRSESMVESVHLCDFPISRKDLRDEELEEAMIRVKAAVRLGHALRKEHKLKVRQPLAKAYVISPKEKALGYLKQHEHLIADELNVKEVVFSLDEAQFVTFQATPNFRLLGKRVGKKMPAVKKAIEALEEESLVCLMENKPTEISVDGELLTISPEEVAVVRSVKQGMEATNEGCLTLALDTALNEELLLEGLAREIVNKVNTMRRDSGFDVSDRIKMIIDSNEKVKACFDQWESYITNEVLAIDVTFASCKGTEWDLNGELATISLERIRKESVQNVNQ